ncbi:MAG: 1-deoxy-D-xylulose-5-phosphate reductoisomerase [Cyanobacteria bacterium DS2.3.42]|nr:1-deoxy-D-xylulose-5-phosphate reductoisomerase [Cyanobacteria bacterium DS2.3.42]
MATKKISLLGSTGSIGRQTLDIALAHKDSIEVVALAAGAGNLDVFADQIKLFRPTVVCVPTDENRRTLLEKLGSNIKVEIETGSSGLETVAAESGADTVVTGVVGFLGLKPTARAIEKGKTIALANKETLVAAGSAVMPMVQKYGAKIVPVDSEHSAIFQSLCGHTKEDVHSIWLTASGGPFRTWSKEQIEGATKGDALNHPNWNMGQKITIDSATLMNKGLEIVEARWLFDITADKIRVVVHPQSILHSAVEFVDGSIIGQMGLPDMRLPIHYALFHPERVYSERVPRLDLTTLSQLTFEEPDTERFPCLAIAKKVAAEDNTSACVMNAANEIVVAAFLNDRIAFRDIPRLIEQVLEKHKPISKPDLDDILEADRWARQEADNLLKSRAA